MLRNTGDSNSDDHVAPPSDRARGLLDRNLRQVGRKLKGIRPNARQDVEAVHAARVAARRAEASLRLFAGWLPRRPSKKMRRQLHQLREQTGTARDLDVMDAWIQRVQSKLPRETLARLKKQVRQDQQDARRPFRKVAGRKARKNLKQCQQELVERWAWRGKDPEPEMANLLKDRLKATRWLNGRPRKLPVRDADLHRLRIQARKLRYEVELLAALDAAPPGRLEPLLETLCEFQDQVGGMHDRAVQSSRLQKWLHSSGKWGRKVEKLARSKDAATRISTGSRRRAERLWKQLRAVAARLM